jgi:Family of unknown function (DUF5684)
LGAIRKAADGDAARRRLRACKLPKRFSLSPAAQSVKREPFNTLTHMKSHLLLTQNWLLANVSLLAQVDYSYSTEGQPPGPLFWICWLVFVVLMIAALWKVFSKAGHPGWASIIPIYNLYVWCKIVGRPGWWVILMFIPFVNIVVGIILCIDMAKSFGKGVGFGIGLALLGIIFLPILGFGSAQYQGAAAAPGAAVSQPATGV